MNTDRKGKIFRQEWMRFMERSSTGSTRRKKGEIDPKELLKSTAALKHVRPSDLGK